MPNPPISKEALEALFASDESDRIERTRTAADNKDKIGQAICAFANDLPGHGKPGVLFIGQDDNKECASLTIDDRLLQNISAYASDGNILPPPSMTVQKHTLHGCEVCVAVVQPSASPPVRYKGTCWVRVGPRKKTASAQEELQLTEKRQAGDLPFIEQALRPPLPLDELNLDFFKNQYLPLAVSPDTLEENNRSIKQQLQSLGFLTRDNHPNRAAVLCLHDHPSSYIGCAYVQCVRFNGDDLTDPDVVQDKQEMRGNIFEQIREMERYFNINIKKPAHFADGKRVDTYDYPLVALNEIIRNAILHRQYEGTNAPVMCRWFPDRVEIISPGGPYGASTIENFAVDEGITDSRNLVLAQAARNMGYAEQFGSGIPKAKEAMKKNGNPGMEFCAKQNTISVVLRPVAR